MLDKKIPFRINEKGETSVTGLYSAGDESMGGISCAAVYGWIAGENAASYAREVSLSENNPIYTGLKDKKDIIQGLESRKNGPDWQEVNIALQQLMQVLEFLIPYLLKMFY